MKIAKELLKIADELDQNGLFAHADQVQQLAIKLANEHVTVDVEAQAPAPGQAAGIVLSQSKKEKALIRDIANFIEQARNSTHETDRAKFTGFAKKAKEELAKLVAARTQMEAELNALAEDIPPSERKAILAGLKEKAEAALESIKDLKGLKDLPRNIFHYVKGLLPRQSYKPLAEHLADETLQKGLKSGGRAAKILAGLAAAYAAVSKLLDNPAEDSNEVVRAKLLDAKEKFDAVSKKLADTTISEEDRANTARTALELLNQINTSSRRHFIFDHDTLSELAKKQEELESKVSKL